MDKDTVIDQIRAAFGPNVYPGDWCLCGSNEGEEPYLLEQEFKGQTDWTTVNAEFLDQAPDGFASALSFFSDEAFRFYLPAYLVADLQEQLMTVDPVFHLCHGLDNSSRDTPINPRRYGGRTWFDYATFKFSMFSREEIQAIVAYLKYKLAQNATMDWDKKTISEALENYWLSRALKAHPRHSE